MLRIADWIDRLNQTIGRALSFAVLALVLLQFTVVILRYVFGIGSVWMQEALIYLFASLFMLTAAYALKRDAHVRVDLWHGTASPRAKLIVDLIGTVLFLWPVAAAILFWSWRTVAQAVAIREGSAETSGIAAVWLLKVEILLFAALLALQGLATLIRGGHALSRPTDAREA